MEKKINIELYLLYISENLGWFVNRDFGCLLELNLQTGQCNLLTKVLQCDGTGKFYSVRYKKDEYLYLFPENKGSILIYNMKTMQFHELKISNSDNDNIGVSEVHIINNTLYAVCSGLGKIVVLNQDSILDLYDIQENIEGYSVSIGSKIFCVSYKSEAIVEFDSQDGETNCYSLPERMMNIACDRTKIWLSGYKPYVYTWDYLSHEVSEKIEIPQVFLSNIINKERPIFQRIVSSENYVWCIPYSTNYFVYIHKKDKKINMLEVGQRKFVSYPKAWFRCIGVIDNRYLLVSSIRQAKLFQIDMEQLVVRERTIIMQDDVWQSILENHFHKKVVQESCGGSSLCNYFSYIRKNAERKKEKGFHKNNGKEIYDAVFGTGYHQAVTYKIDEKCTH